MKDTSIYAQAVKRIEGIDGTLYELTEMLDHNQYIT